MTINSLMNNTEVGKAQIPKKEAIQSHAVLESALIIPFTDFVFFDLYKVKILPEVKKNEAFAKECPIK